MFSLSRPRKGHGTSVANMEGGGGGTHQTTTDSGQRASRRRRQPSSQPPRPERRTCRPPPPPETFRTDKDVGTRERAGAWRHSGGIYTASTKTVLLSLGTRAAGSLQVSSSCVRWYGVRRTLQATRKGCPHLFGAVKSINPHTLVIDYSKYDASHL